MAFILLVDDDQTLLELVTLALEDHGHTVQPAHDGLEALSAMARRPADLVLSDVNMPKLDGFTLCKNLRARDANVPIILLTSRDSEIDEALGLELGADDYITKPFSTRVLLARINALLRRTEARREPRKAKLVQGALELDPERLDCQFQGTSIRVTVTEFRLLEALARRPGILLTREQLMRSIRDDDAIVVDRLIDTYVRRLRRKLESIDAKFNDIETVVGVGYRWREG